LQPGQQLELLQVFRVSCCGLCSLEKLIFVVAQFFSCQYKPRSKPFMGLFRSVRQFMSDIMS